MQQIQQFKIGAKIGEGAFGKVYKGLNLKTGNFVAIKQIKLNQPLTHDYQQAIQEIDLLQRFSHQYIVRYLGCRQQVDMIEIYMEYMAGGSISSMIKQYGKFNEEVIQKFVIQLLDGLDYLHHQGIVHRDIKGANILSDGQGNIKLSDFGAARYILPLLKDQLQTDICKSMKGSPFWMAPEVLNSEGYGIKSDIWSLGCTIIEMATAQHPWKDCKSMPQLIIKIMNEKCPPVPQHLSQNCQDFIKKCCTFDKNIRPSTEELKNHLFLQIL